MRGPETRAQRAIWRTDAHGELLGDPVFKATAVLFPRHVDQHARLRTDGAHPRRSSVGEQSRFRDGLRSELHNSRSVTVRHHVAPRWRNGPKRES